MYIKSRTSAARRPSIAGGSHPISYSATPDTASQCAVSRSSPGVSEPLRVSVGHGGKSAGTVALHVSVVSARTATVYSTMLLRPVMVWVVPCTRAEVVPSSEAGDHATS